MLTTLIFALSNAMVSGYGFPDCVNGPLAKNLVCNTKASAVDRAKAVIADFTVDELVANTGYISPGVERLGLPAYNWWSEGLHGVASSPGVKFQPAGQDFSFATSFPAPILMSAAFDDQLINDVATVISTEARAFNNFGFAGIDYFTPNINPFKDPRWGRGQETPGEDPFRISQYVFQLVHGLQGGDGTQPYTKIIADCKHWAAYDMENWEGNNRMAFDAIVSQQDLSEYYAPSFQSCVRDAHVNSVMCSYNAVNGIPSCANDFLLQTILRDTWGLKDDKWIVSDCDAIGNIFDPHHYTADLVNASAVALKAGVDIDCGPTYAGNLGQALNASLITEAELRQALTRQYASLVKLGYFDPASQQPFRQLAWKDVNTPNAQQLAYETAIEGIVLLKNDGHLPLNKRSTRSIAVIGPWANATTTMQSNYNGPAPFLISPLLGLQNAGFKVNYALGTNMMGNTTEGLPAALAAARASDVIIFAGGIDLTIEAEQMDRTTITWPGNQLDLANELASVGKPLIVLQMGGGQLDSSSLKSNPKVNALLWGGYPGQSGGTALADILVGNRAPAGRLTTTQYPAEYAAQIAMTDMTLRPNSTGSPGRTYKWYKGTPVFDFGFGLHYTTFDLSWSGRTASTNSYNIQQLVSSAKRSGTSFVDLGLLDTFELTVRNTGHTASDYIALLFSSTNAGPSPAPLKELVSYTRVKSLAPGRTATASLRVALNQIARVDEDGNRVLFPGTYNLWIDTTKQISRKIELTGQAEQIATWPKAS